MVSLYILLFVGKQYKMTMVDKLIGDNVIDDKLVDDYLIGDRVVDDKVIGDKLAADNLIGDRVVGDKLVADNMIGDKLVADYMVGDKSESRPQGHFPIELFRDHRLRRKRHSPGLNRSLLQKKINRTTKDNRTQQSVNTERRDMEALKLGVLDLLPSTAFYRQRLQRRWAHT